MKWRVNEQIELIHIEINGRIGETLFFFFKNQCGEVYDAWRKRNTPLT